MSGRAVQDPLILYRHRFEHVWDFLPALTLLIALAGWGRTTWMRQCAARLTERYPDLEIARPRSRGELERRLGDRAPGAAPSVWIADDLVGGAGDPLWETIARALQSDPDLRLIIACDGAPMQGAIPALEPLTLDERELAFDADEIDALVAQALAGEEHVDVAVVPEQTRGCPVLVHQFLKKVLARREQGVWAAPEPSPELPLLATLPPLPSELLPGADSEAAQPGDVEYLDWLRRARGFRTFTVDLLAVENADRPAEGEQLNWFARAGMHPLFVADTDDETGSEALSWTARAWAALEAETPPAQRRAELTGAVRRITATGRTALALFPLLELGEQDRAEALLRTKFRDFLMFADGHASELLSRLRPDPATWPALALLETELRSRAEGFSREARDIARTALSTLEPLRATSFNDELGRATLCAFAAVSAGDRARAHRLLDHAGELAAAPGGIDRDRLTTRARTRLVGRFYLAYWAALQLDRHTDALRCATRMVELGEPSDRLFALEQVSLTTEQDLAGLRSLEGVGEDGLLSHAVSFRHLEEGRDEDALAFIRPIFERRAPEQSRSAIDALVLIVRAQTDPEGLSREEVRRVLTRSRALWLDRRPSSFIAWAAAVAFSVLGSREEAHRILEDLDGEDPFSRLARAAVALAEGDFRGALAAGGALDASELPRLLMLSRVYAAAAHLHLENLEGARYELAEGWRRVPSARLLRFALRFVPQETAARLITLPDIDSDELPDPLVDALRRADDDPRPVVWQIAPPLTRAEREILRLMQQGLKNAEIAIARHVTLSTLRSQIRPLYRKLGVSDRAAALRMATRFRLLDPND